MDCSGFDAWHSFPRNHCLYPTIHMVIKVEPMLLSLLIVSKMSTFQIGLVPFLPRNFGNGSEARRPRDFWMSKQECESMGALGSPYDLNEGRMPQEENGRK